MSITLLPVTIKLQLQIIQPITITTRLSQTSDSAPVSQRRYRRAAHYGQT